MPVKMHVIYYYKTVVQISAMFIQTCFNLNLFTLSKFPVIKHRDSLNYFDHHRNTNACTPIQEFIFYLFVRLNNKTT